MINNSLKSESLIECTVCTHRSGLVRDKFIHFFSQKTNCHTWFFGFFIFFWQLAFHPDQDNVAVLTDTSWKARSSSSTSERSDPRRESKRRKTISVNCYKNTLRKMPHIHYSYYYRDSNWNNSCGYDCGLFTTAIAKDACFRYFTLCNCVRLSSEEIQIKISHQLCRLNLNFCVMCDIFIVVSYAGMCLVRPL